VRRVKAVSLSYELVAIQRAVEGAAVLTDLGRHGGLEGEDTEALVSAILALAVCRLRDLGRTARGTLDVEVFRAPHNTAVEVTGEEDVVLRPKHVATKKKGRRRG